MGKYEIGIVDTRNILKAIQEQYDYDFRNYALTFFKRRLESILEKYNLKTADNLIRRIKIDEPFFNTFLKEICIETTEMFRDPSLWRYLMDDFLSPLVQKYPSFKIWFPEVNSGEELFSLIILLNELNLLNHVEIHASSVSQLLLDQAKEGYFEPSKMELNEANFNRIFRNKVLKDYYSMENNRGFLNKELLKPVKFFLQNTVYEQFPKGVKLIFWRNQMLYFNQILEERILKSMCGCLVPGGHLIIGLNEKIDYWNSNKDYILVGNKDSIYKKKFS